MSGNEYLIRLEYGSDGSEEWVEPDLRSAMRRYNDTITDLTNDGVKNPADYVRLFVLVDVTPMRLLKARKP